MRKSRRQHRESARRQASRLRQVCLAMAPACMALADANLAYGFGKARAASMARHACIVICALRTRSPLAGSGGGYGWRAQGSTKRSSRFLHQSPMSIAKRQWAPLQIPSQRFLWARHNLRRAHLCQAREFARDLQGCSFARIRLTPSRAEPQPAGQNFELPQTMQAHSAVGVTSILFRKCEGISAVMNRTHFQTNKWSCSSSARRVSQHSIVVLVRRVLILA